MDDLLVFADAKPALWEVVAEVRRFARDRLRLTMKDRATVVAPVTEGIPWLGFRVFPGLLRIDAAGRRRFGRKIAASVRAAAQGALADEPEVARAASLCGHLKIAHTRALRRSILARLDTATGSR